MIYGNELIIDLKRCSNINKKSIVDFVKQLCVLIKMKRWGKTHVVYFGKKRFKGYSVMQFITTSSIVGHFTKDEIYLNIFSCKKINSKNVLKFTKQWYLSDNCKSRFLRR